MASKNWTREELILAFNLYLKIEFSKTHKGNPKVIELSNIIDRTPSAVGMRLGNFASVDPYHQQRGVTGLRNGIKQVQPIWDDFFNNQEDLIFESERILAEKENITLEDKYNSLFSDIKDLKGETKIRAVKTRVNQSVFREIILTNYRSKCAITGINIPDLLYASHIIPWSKNEKERLNPENGICLSALYDRSFDKGYLSFSDNYKVLLSSKLKEKSNTEYYSKYFASIENTTLIKPIKYYPSKLFLEYHRDEIFDKNKHTP
ncbi:HNH endonuclease [Flavobacterium arcticum]|uniref:HNH endonuclease n=1 Tax=Flavobacterium arcticum TaxID=1784713 RepID=A0A345HBA4_9FLAO|nr:HNH endonuclease [Flavobacterium arcticum]AXG73864.1 HNH endonuclease [Flavobacterium arcticum]KAF2511817.1 HNH endonuclease [Flavobacterium arcticum]